MKSATRIVIPLLQMVLVVVVYWFAAVHSSDELIHRNYISPAVRLLIKVNFFQIVILYPILVGLNGLNHCFICLKEPRQSMV